MIARLLRSRAGSAAGLLMATTLASGCERPAPPQPVQQQSVSPEWQAPASELQNYWRTRGLGGLSVRVIVVGPNEQADCDGRQIGPDDKHIAAYCPLGNTIVIAANTTRGLEKKYRGKGGDPAFFGLLILSHEMGHAVQDTSGQLSRNNAYTELQADCLGGEALHDIRNPRNAAPGALHASGVALYEALGMTSDNGASHGTPSERIHAFNQGSYTDGNNHHMGCGVRPYTAFPDVTTTDGI